MQELNQQLQEFVEEFFSASELNRFPKEFGGGWVFAQPLTGVACGDDQIFKKFKEVVGPKHLTPLEMWAESNLPQDQNTEARLRTVSIIFPYSKEIRAAGKANPDPEIPPEIYCLGRNLANPFMISVLKAVEIFFQKKGFSAVAGSLSKAFKVNKELVPSQIYSTWSERHLAFAAGLGTFSLHEAMITEVGCNVRFASVVTDAPLTVTPQTNDEPFANCLYLANGSCGECIDKCPANAITKDGHDKQKCAQQVRKAEEEIARRPLKSLLVPDQMKSGDNNIVQYSTGCALCQFDVPCMEINPILKK